MPPYLRCSIMPIISIAFYMVIIRVGAAKVAPSRQEGSSGVGNPIGQMHNRDYAMRPLEVHISQLTETQKDTTDERSDVSISKRVEEV